jgi:hypothetical protein
MKFGRRVAEGAVGLILAALVVTGLAGCGPTYTYLTSTSSESYLAVPHSWKVYDQKTILAQTGSTGSFAYLAFFDDNSHPALKDSLSATAKPWGVIRIRDLAASEQATYSFDSLQNELIEFDQMEQAGQAEAVGPAEVLTAGSLRGIRQEVAVVSGGKTILADMEGYVNNATTKAWALLVGCSAACFNRNQSEINRLVHSWTVGKS